MVAEGRDAWRQRWNGDTSTSILRSKKYTLFNSLNCSGQNMFQAEKFNVIAMSRYN
jgi:hypothetical protein